MTTRKINDVFGINSRKILSYIERPKVDDAFKNALKSDRQILVYGSSKQGKTALVSKYCGYNEHIVYQLTPETELEDIYQTVLRQAGVTIRTEVTEGKGISSSLRARAKIIASFAIFGKGSAELGAELTGDRSTSSKYEEIPFNISQPQDVSNLLKKIGCKKIIILENFHYLTDNNQVKFAHDLRAFQELGVRFIILGVWQEKNRMAQFNGDLLDRVEEIPVEPWLEEDFLRIVSKGEKLLKIKLPKDVILKCCDLSFSSVGVFQDLLLKICQSSGVHECKNRLTHIDNIEDFSDIIQEKAHAYGSRHRRALEGIASSPRNNDKNKLYYHIVDIILDEGFEGIRNGMSMQHIYDRVCKRSSNKIKPRTVKGALKGIHKVQVDKKIRPAILSYDDNSSLLNVIDSTMYFFLKNLDVSNFRQQLKDSYETRI